VEWESRQWDGRGGRDSNAFKADDSLRSFLFTLKNPDNIPARRFALKGEKRWAAISCKSEVGPNFDDMCVYDICSTCAASRFCHKSLGFAYTNNTGLGNNTVFTDSFHFQGKEIEFFEITE
jgi:hypothetical protein